MGIFGSLFSKKKQSAKEMRSVDKYLEQLQAKLDAQDRAISKVCTALQVCEDTENSDEALEEYRQAIVQARKEDVNLSTAHDFRLVNGYIKRKKYDTAWGYLNGMVISHPNDLWKIRKEMCRICKKESHWAGALCYLMMSHASKYSEFNETAFLEDIGPIARKLSLSEDDCKHLANKLASLKGDQLKCDAGALRVYRQFYEERLKS